MAHRTSRSRFRPRLAALLLTSVLGVGLCSQGNGAPPPRAQATEAARLSLLHELIAQRAELARTNKSAALQQCDARIKSLPAPSDSDAGELSRRLVGTWRSPRHDHLYRADGSWTMLPAESDAPHGNWRIAGNQLEVASSDAGQRSKNIHTVILIGDDDLVYADRETVFFEKRLSRPKNTPATKR